MRYRIVLFTDVFCTSQNRQKVVRIAEETSNSFFWGDFFKTTKFELQQWLNISTNMKQKKQIVRKVAFIVLQKQILNNKQSLQLLILHLV